MIKVRLNDTDVAVMQDGPIIELVKGLTLDRLGEATHYDVSVTEESGSNVLRYTLSMQIVFRIIRNG